MSPFAPQWPMIFLRCALALALLGVPPLQAAPAGKPTVPMAQAVDAASVILVVQREADGSACIVRRTLLDRSDSSYVAGERLLIDLGGLALDPKVEYVVFLTKDAKTGKLAVVPQMRTEASPANISAIKDRLQKRGQK